MVSQAIIAAAGNGTRFLPLTKAYPKELLPVWDKPMIQILIEELVGAGFKEVLIIHHPVRPQIKDYFMPDHDLELFLREVGKSDWLNEWRKLVGKINIHFLPQRTDLPYGTGTPVLTAEKFIGNKPFAYLYGDDLVLEKKPGRFLSSLVKTFEKHKAAAVFGAQKVPWKEVQRYGSIRYVKKGKVPNQIETVEEGLPQKKAPSNFVLFGRFVVSHKVIDVLKELPVSKKNELFFTDAMKEMAKNDVVIAQPTTTGKWLTIGDPDRWLQANIEFQKFMYKSKKK